MRPGKRAIRERSVPSWSSDLSIHRKRALALRRRYQRTKNNADHRQQRRQQYQESNRIYQAKLYCLLVLCHYVHCCLVQSVHCLSVTHTVPSVVSVSLCPLLSCTVCPLSVSNSQCTVCCFCVSMSTAVFYSLSTVCQ
jgi:hypothetical protein